MPRTIINLTGQTFGRLTVRERGVQNNLSNKKRAYWICECSCGAIKTIASDKLRLGETKSCGCFREEELKKGREDLVKRQTRHGKTHHPLFQTWNSMKNRCSNPCNPDYPHYGGRGIYVCEEWRTSFEKFLEDIGDKPSDEYTLDRIDVNGPYSKENCKWSNSYEQMNNRRNVRLIEYKGKTMCISEWADEYYLNPETLRRRLNNGWSIERALTTPVRTL